MVGAMRSLWHPMSVVLGIAALTAGCAPLGPPRVPAEAAQDIVFTAREVFPESISADRAGNIYAGSADGVIYRAMAGARVAKAWILPDERNRMRSVFGVLADDDRGLLLACANPDFANPSPGATAALVMFSLADGTLSARFDLPAGPAICNDISLAPDGAIYLTETLGGRIFVLREGANELALFAAGEELAGVDGIAFAADGTLYINNVRQNLLQRVERDGEGAFRGLTALTLSRPLAGPDGLRLVAGHTFVQAESAGDAATLVTVTGDLAEIASLASLDSPAAVTHHAGTGYAAEGKIRYRVQPELRGQDPGVFTIRAFALPKRD